MGIENGAAVKLSVSELLALTSGLDESVLSQMDLKWTLLGETYYGVPRSYKEKINVLFVAYKNGDNMAVFAIDKDTCATDFAYVFKEDEQTK